MIRSFIHSYIHAASLLSSPLLSSPLLSSHSLLTLFFPSSRCFLTESQRIQKYGFTQKWEFSHYLFHPHADAKVEFGRPRNISGASQQNNIVAFSKTTEVDGGLFLKRKNFPPPKKTYKMPPNSWSGVTQVSWDLKWLKNPLFTCYLHGWVITKWINKCKIIFFFL